MNVLGIFVKYPMAGEVKSRLAESIGATRPADLYAAFTADVLERFRKVADERYLCYASSQAASLEAANYFRDAAREDYRLWAQPAGDLGFKLQAFFERALFDGAERAIVIGSDSPTLPVEYVLRGFRELESHDCILGPAVDGGYYLIGLRTAAVEKFADSRSDCDSRWGIFDRIPWSSPHVFEQTVRRLAACHLTYGVLPPWYDVDTVDDLARLRADLIEKKSDFVGDASPRTRAALAGLSSGGRPS